MGSIKKTLGQSEQVKVLVQESAEQLSTANATLVEAVAEGPPHPSVVAALEQTTEVETKVQDASDQLAEVNSALKHEVDERHLLELELLDLTAQSAADRHASLHDPLTGLPNRALFYDRLQHGVSQAARHGWTLAVIFLDLNGFKAVNDEHGHAVGDAVLKMTADRLREVTRADDTVCRRSGDEFLYLLLEVKREADVRVVADKLLTAIARPCVVKLAGRTATASVTASVGVAVYPRDGTTAEALADRADAAMYRAKKEGLGVVFAEL